MLRVDSKLLDGLSKGRLLRRLPFFDAAAGKGHLSCVICKEEGALLKEHVSFSLHIHKGTENRKTVIQPERFRRVFI